MFYSDVASSLVALFATIAAIMIKFATIDLIEDGNTKAQVWLFVWVAVSTICIGASIFILSTDCPVDDNYPAGEINYEMRRLFGI